MISGLMRRDVRRARRRLPASNARQCGRSTRGRPAGLPSAGSGNTSSLWGASTWPRMRFCASPALPSRKRERSASKVSREKP